MFSGIERLRSKKELENEIQIYIEKMRSFNLLFKTMHMEVQQNFLLQHQYHLWQHSQLRLELNNDEKKTSSTILASPDFIKWHEAYSLADQEFQHCINELSQFILKNNLPINVDDIIFSAKDFKNKYFPAYQLVFENQKKELNVNYDLNEIAELQKEKEKINAMHIYNSEQRQFYFTLYALLSFVGIGIPFLLAYAAMQMIETMCYQLTNLQLDFKIDVSNREIKNKENEIKNTIKKTFKKDERNLDKYDSQVALSQRLFKAARDKYICENGNNEIDFCQRGFKSTL